MSDTICSFMRVFLVFLRLECMCEGKVTVEGVEAKMEQWFAANLGDAVLAGEALDRVCALFAAQERSPATAVLVRHENIGRLHCELVLYFPPELADLAASVGAEPCGRPGLAGLGIAIGSPQRLEEMAREE